MFAHAVGSRYTIRDDTGVWKLGVVAMDETEFASSSDWVIGDSTRPVVWALSEVVAFPRFCFTAKIKQQFALYTKQYTILYYYTTVVPAVQTVRCCPLMGSRGQSGNARARQHSRHSPLEWWCFQTSPENTKINRRTSNALKRVMLPLSNSSLEVL